MSMWALPVASMAASLLVTAGLLRVPSDPASALARALWPGGSDSASSVMQTLATSAVTATSLTFSAVLVALQLASQQFSPRLLRDFARDRFTQGVLGALLATFAASLTVLRHLDPQTELPVVALCWAYLLGLATVALLLGYLAHMMRQLRVDTMMRTVHQQAVRAIDAAYAAADEPERLHPPDDPGRPQDAVVARARRSGFCRRIDVDGLTATSAAAGAYVRVIVRPGDQVLMGTPVAYAWPTFGGAGDLDPDDLVDMIDLGYERSFDQDTAFGFRRLVDIAVKAMSPAVNDPATAAQAIGHMGDLLVRLLDRQLGPTAHRDQHGTIRVTVPDRDLRYYLDLSCAQVRRYGGRDAALLSAVLRMLRDVAVSARDDSQRDEVRRQRDLVLSEVSDELVGEDVRGVEEAAARVEQALRGHLDEAFHDRNGHLRSI